MSIFARVAVIADGRVCQATHANGHRGRIPAKRAIWRVDISSRFVTSRGTIVVVTLDFGRTPVRCG